MIAKSWFDRCWQWQIGGCVAIFGTLCAMGGDRVNAQIVPDNTLGAEGSVVTPNLNLNGIPIDQIDGGAIRGANLFHSFAQFNINAGRGAYFTNPAGIANILSRVTGANRSEINGRLGVLGGNANLFLINPNGIVFGPSASLDLQGSFVATTANAVEFGDRGIFSASAPKSPQLLNVNPSAFLLNQIPPGGITNQSVLQVPQGQNLILLGGNVNLDGGVLRAPSGRVELAGLAESGRVGINQESNNLSLIFPDGGVRADISLSDRALVEAGGDIQVLGRRVTLTQGSRIKTATEGGANAGNITVNTGQLIVRDGAQVTASTSGQGQGGTVVVNAFESIELSGTSTNGQESGLFADTQIGDGDAGDIKVDTGQLTLSDRALITSRSRGMGRAGNIVVTVRGTLQANNGTIGTSATKSAGGAITVKAGDIRLFGNSNITTSVLGGAGGGGNIDLKADSILAFDDSDILAFADGGKGGDITLDTPAFFGESYRPAPRNTDPRTLDRNNRVDVNATGATDGVISTPDTSSIENSLTELPDDRIDIDSLLATSCIARRDRPTRGSFTVTGTGGLQERPGDAQMSNFPTVDVETLPSDSTPSNPNPNRSWQKGDPIVEPQGVYRLPNGQLVLSRECS